MTSFPRADGNQQFHLFSPVKSIEDQPKEQKAKRAASRRNLRVVERAETAPLFDLLVTSESEEPCLAVASTDAHAAPGGLIPIPFTADDAEAKRAAIVEHDDAPAADSPAIAVELPQAAQSALPPNYVIADIHALIAGGPKAKLRRNIEAIRLLKQLSAEGRAPDAAEKEVLAQFCGWGQFPQVFGESADPAWDNERAEVRALLSEAEYDAARQSTINAHYTNPQIVLAIWEMAARLGFAGGRVEEPGCGVGYFIGCAPRNIAARSRFTGIELDPVTSRIAGLLYPQANIHNKAFQQVPHLEGFYDLVIGNVPFADVAVLSDPRYRNLRPLLHDYFVIRSVDETRPGALAVLLTSTGTLDKQDDRVRAEIARKADLIAAIRLPEKTHKANAGTDVVTDLLILRRRFDGEAARGPAWLNVVEVADPDGGDPIPVNEYFAANPQQILGRLDRSGTIYAGNQVNVSRTPDFETLLAEAIERLPQDIYIEAGVREERPRQEAAPSEVKEHGFLLRDGRLYVRRSGVLVEFDCDAATLRIITDALTVRGCLRALFDAQLEGAGEVAIKSARRELNLAYDRFVSWHGPLNLPKNKKAFSADPDAPLLLALEHYNPKRKSATKAAIFHRDTIRSFHRTGSAATVSEALAVTLNETGRVNLERMGELLKAAPEAVAAELVREGLAFNDPVEGWQPASIYLSGNVRLKLEQAREAARVDPQFAPNVAALEPVIPEDIDHVDIDVRLGAPWIPPSDIVRFMCDLLRGEPRHFEAHFLPNQGTWLVGYTKEGELLHETKTLATEIYGTPRVNFIDVMQHALDNRAIVIYDEDPGGARVVNFEQSAAASAKMREIRTLFSEWVWEDDERRARLHRTYNDTFNSHRAIKWDGSHLSFPGLASHIELRQSQKDAVWRGICTGRACFGHEVGAGKSLILCAIPLELRRLGLARKPLLAVLKNTIDQIVAKAREAYPHARILTTQERFDAEGRKQIISQIATGDYDLIIITHDQLDMLRMTSETQQKFIQGEIAELEYVMSMAEAEGGKGGNRIVKRLAKAKERLQEQLLEAIEGGNKDDVLYFEELGVDFLLIDESQYYKSLPVRTKQDRIKGIPTTRSDRATNMYMRTSWLLEANKGRGVVFATGTPVANTLCELFIIQQYLQRAELLERGLHTFDSWSACFAEIVTRLEVDVVGQYRPVSRLASYTNLPELLGLVRQVMDVKLAENIPDIKRPRKVEEVITAPINGEQKDFLADLQARASIVRSSKPVKGGDNMLSITTDARKLSVDSRLVMRRAVDDEGSKLNLLIRNVLALYHEKPQQRTQLIFSDLGIYDNSWGYSVFKEIRTKLVAGGIPADKIIDFSTLSDKARPRAIKRLDEGDAVVGIGSTKKMGVGVNLQSFVFGIHLLDVPWLPSDLEQRIGRGWRDQNKHYDWGEAIKVFRYVAVGSFDQFNWQILDTKIRFIKQIMTEGDVPRKYKEVDTEEISPATLMAIASGNPDLLLKVQLDEKVSELMAARRRHERAQIRLRDDAKWARSSIDNLTKHITALEYDSAQVQATASDAFSMMVEGTTYTHRKQAALNLTVACCREKFVSGRRVIGSIRGFSIIQSGYSVAVEREGEYSFNINPENPNGTLASLESVLRHIGGRVNEARQNLESHKTNLAMAEANIGKPFKQAAELEAATAELDEVTSRLKGEAAVLGQEAAAA